MRCVIAGVLLCKHAGAVRSQTHLIGLSHVAVQNPSHALDGRMLQLVSSSHIIVDASAGRGPEDKHVRTKKPLF